MRHSPRLRNWCGTVPPLPTRLFPEQSLAISGVSSLPNPLSARGFPRFGTPEHRSRAHPPTPPHGRGSDCRAVGAGVRVRARASSVFRSFRDYDRLSRDGRPQ